MVFTDLYNGWKEYTNFITGLTDIEVKRALDKLRKEILDGQKQIR